ncbi:ROK family protein [Fundicoccus culcitae]|uniref:ROK family protein n=1 Tax=Fundicoccus culcitae TaxID=2969821 RepID=A0ABY5P9D5_9LACT|nr:ROK family protein [Fundicoccus culcitae]UUX35284.1 ROK family protein [Fundicoccus culcitae]
MTTIALIDIGGTQIKFGIMNADTNHATTLGSIDTRTDLPDFNMLTRIDLVIHQIQQHTPTIQGIAISTAGVVNPDTGKIVHANPNIPNYAGKPLREELEQAYGLPVSVENDVNAALLGEIYHGNHHPVSSALMLTIGTGVGGALFLNHQIYHGYAFSAGEVGYSFLNDQNIEDVVSARALVNRVQQTRPDEKVDGFYIFKQLEAQDPVITDILDDYCQQLAKAIINQVSLINPEIVILGGGIMEQTDYFQPKLTHYFEQFYTNQYAAQRTHIAFASLGNKAGLLGAYQHYKNQHL